MTDILDKVKWVFSKTDKIIKGFAMFMFIACIILGVIFILFASMGGGEELIFVSLSLLLSSVATFPVYGFGEIITQLKEINYTSYCSYRNSIENKTKEK